MIDNKWRPKASNIIFPATPFKKFILHIYSLAEQYFRKRNNLPHKEWYCSFSVLSYKTTNSSYITNIVRSSTVIWWCRDLKYILMRKQPCVHIEQQNTQAMILGLASRVPWHKFPCLHTNGSTGSHLCMMAVCQLD